MTEPKTLPTSSPAQAGEAGPVILITGASSGIGAETARLFARQGYRVVLAARRLERLESLAAEISQAGSQGLPVETDMTELDDLSALVETSLAHFGQIDVLLNNAGFGSMDWLEQLDPRDDIAAQIQVNLTGLIQLTGMVLPHMIARRAGHIINMASIASLIATPTYSVYAASKFGLHGFTQALRREVGVYGIHVSGIYPGGVHTEFGQNKPAQRKTGVRTPKFLRLESEDVAQAVLQVTRRPRRSLVIPWPMLPAVWVNQFFPGLVDWVLEQRFVRPERGL